MEDGTRSQAEREDLVGMRLAFWTWMALVVVGLAYMIALPLSGR